MLLCSHCVVGAIVCTLCYVVGAIVCTLCYVVGAIFLDSGIEEADKFLAKYLDKSLNFVEFKPVWMDLPLHPLQVWLFVYSMDTGL